MGRSVLRHAYNAEGTQITCENIYNYFKFSTITFDPRYMFLCLVQKTKLLNPMQCALEYVDRNSLSERKFFIQILGFFISSPKRLPEVKGILPVKLQPNVSAVDFWFLYYMNRT